MEQGAPARVARGGLPLPTVTSAPNGVAQSVHMTPCSPGNHTPQSHPNPLQQFTTPPGQGAGQWHVDGLSVCLTASTGTGTNATLQTSACLPSSHASSQQFKHNPDGTIHLHPSHATTTANGDDTTTAAELCWQADCSTAGGGSSAACGDQAGVIMAPCDAGNIMQVWDTVSPAGATGNSSASTATIAGASTGTIVLRATHSKPTPSPPAGNTCIFDSAAHARTISVSDNGKMAQLTFNGNANALGKCGNRGNRGNAQHVGGGTSSELDFKVTVTALVGEAYVGVVSTAGANPHSFDSWVCSFGVLSAHSPSRTSSILYRGILTKVSHTTTATSRGTVCLLNGWHGVQPLQVNHNNSWGVGSKGFKASDKGYTPFGNTWTHGDQISVHVDSSGTMRVATNGGAMQTAFVGQSITHYSNRLAKFKTSNCSGQRGLSSALPVRRTVSQGRV